MRRQKGFITVEACMVVPLFLFFMLAMASVIMLLLAEAHIHQSLVEAAGYTAQYACRIIWFFPVKRILQRGMKAC